MMSEKRNSIIDFYKGVLMLGVVWGHMITALRNGKSTSLYLVTFFRTYDMPFFMLVSGYFLFNSVKKNKWQMVIINKLGTILFPLIVWQILIAVITGSKSNFFSLWFLWSILGCTLLVTLTVGIVKNNRFSLFFLIMIITLLHCIPQNVFNLAYMLPYYVCGYYLALYKIDITKSIEEKYLGIVLSVFIVLQCFWSGEYNVWNAGVNVLENFSRQIFVICFRFLIGFIGIIVIKHLCNIFYLNIPQKYKKMVIETGENTFLIYIIQSLLVEIGVAYLVKWFTEYSGINIFVFNTKLLGYFIAPLLSIIVIRVILLICKIIKKNKYLKRIFLGFKISN